MKLPPGKLAGMKAVSDKRGVIAVAAMDQRGSLQKALAKEKGADVNARMMEEFKSIVTEVLTKHASAILLDPEFGLPAASAALVMPDCCWLTRRPDMTKPVPSGFCPVWIALPHPAWVKEYRQRLTRLLTILWFTQFAGHFLKTAIKSGISEHRM